MHVQILESYFDLDALVPALLVISLVYGFVIAVGCNGFLLQPYYSKDSETHFPHDS